MGMVAAAVPALAQEAGPRGGAKAAQGQGGPGGGRMAGRREAMQKARNEVLDTLKLSKEQKKKIEALDKKTEDAMKAIMKDAGSDREKARGKFRSVMESQREGMKKILTAAQYEKFEAAMKKKTEEMRKRGGQRGPGGAPSKPSTKGGGA